MEPNIQIDMNQKQGKLPFEYDLYFHMAPDGKTGTCKSCSRSYQKSSMRKHKYYKCVDIVVAKSKSRKGQIKITSYFTMAKDGLTGKCNACSKTYQKGSMGNHKRYGCVEKIPGPPRPKKPKQSPGSLNLMQYFLTTVDGERFICKTCSKVVPKSQMYDHKVQLCEVKILPLNYVLGGGKNFLQYFEMTADKQIGTCKECLRKVKKPDFRHHKLNDCTKLIKVGKIEEDFDAHKHFDFNKDGKTGNCKACKRILKIVSMRTHKLLHCRGKPKPIKTNGPKYTPKTLNLNQYFEAHEDETKVVCKKCNQVMAKSSMYNHKIFNCREKIQPLLQRDGIAKLNKPEYFEMGENWQSGRCKLCHQTVSAEEMRQHVLVKCTQPTSITDLNEGYFDASLYYDFNEDGITGNCKSCHKTINRRRMRYHKTHHCNGNPKPLILSDCVLDSESMDEEETTVNVIPGQNTVSISSSFFANENSVTDPQREHTVEFQLIAWHYKFFASECLFKCTNCNSFFSHYMLHRHLLKCFENPEELKIDYSELLSFQAGDNHVRCKRCKKSLSFNTAMAHVDKCFPEIKRLNRAQVHAPDDMSPSHPCPACRDILGNPKDLMLHFSENHSNCNREFYKLIKECRPTPLPDDQSLCTNKIFKCIVCDYKTTDVEIIRVCLETHFCDAGINLSL